MLAGVLADINAAFGNTLNTDLSTPQGQLAMSLTAILGDAYDQFLALANGVDPARASGRMQDAIGRLYFMSRLPATATVVTCLCTGVAGTLIPPGALVQDATGNSYAADAAITLDATGTGSGTFSCTQAGEIICPAQSIAISQSLAGWATVTNPVAGVTGRAVESRTAFEERRRISVAANAIGPLDAIPSANIIKKHQTNQCVASDLFYAPIIHPTLWFAVSCGVGRLQTALERFVLAERRVF